MVTVSMGEIGTITTIVCLRRDPGPLGLASKDLGEPKTIVSESP